MYTAEVRIENEGTCTLQAPTLEALYMMIFQLNEDIFVKGIQVSAKDGKMQGREGARFIGYTRSGLKALYEKK